MKETKEMRHQELSENKYIEFLNRIRSFKCIADKEIERRKIKTSILGYD